MAAMSDVACGSTNRKSRPNRASAAAADPTTSLSDEVEDEVEDEDEDEVEDESTEAA